MNRLVDLVTCEGSTSAHPRTETCEDAKLVDLVHGVIALNPPRIQCDGCGVVAEGETGKLAMLVLTCGIVFNPHSADERRLCRECRVVEWPETVR